MDTLSKHELWDRLIEVYCLLTTNATLGRFSDDDPLEKMLDELYAKVDETLDTIEAAG